MRLWHWRYNTNPQKLNPISVCLPSTLCSFSADLFSWQPETTVNEHVLSVGKIKQGERLQRTLMFNAPSAPSDCTLNLVIKYTLESDEMTQIQKAISLDIPVIQPFHATFDILPRIAKDGGMPDPFTEGGYSLGVAQSWLLMSTITRLGSEKLQLQQIGIEGTSVSEDHNLEIQEVTSIDSTSGLPGIPPSKQSNSST